MSYITEKYGKETLKMLIAYEAINAVTLGFWKNLA